MLAWVAMVVIAVALPLAVGFVWVIWAGQPAWTRRWFDGEERSAPLIWPFPVTFPTVMGATILMIERFDGLQRLFADRPVLRTAAWLVPALAAGAWPPRWLFPPWARARAAALPAPGQLDHPDAIPALACRQRRPGPRHLGPWAWRIGAVRGQLWCEDQRLRFVELDDRPEDARHLPPWTQPHRRETALDEVAGIRTHRRWRRVGLVTLERHDGHRERYWLDRRRLRSMLADGATVSNDTGPLAPTADEPRP